MASKKNPVSQQATKKDSAAVKTNASAAKASAPAKESAPASAPTAVTAIVATAPTTRDRSSIVTLIGRLRDPDAETARDAAQTLATLPADGEAVDALCAVVRNADGYFHPVVRAAAAATLGRIGERRAVDALIAGTRDTMVEASEEAVKALGILGDARALIALDNIVNNADHFFLETVRRAAEEAKARISARA